MTPPRHPSIQSLVDAAAALSDELDDVYQFIDAPECAKRLRDFHDELDWHVVEWQEYAREAQAFHAARKDGAA